MKEEITFSADGIMLVNDPEKEASHESIDLCHREHLQIRSPFSNGADGIL